MKIKALKTLIPTLLMSAIAVTNSPVQALASSTLTFESKGRAVYKDPTTGEKAWISDAHDLELIGTDLKSKALAISNLQTADINFDTRISEMTYTLNNQASSINTLNQRITTLEGNISSVTSRVTTLESFKTSQESKNTSFTNSINTLNTFKTNQENKNTSLTNSVNTLSSSVSTAQSDINELESRGSTYYGVCETDYLTNVKVVQCDGFEKRHGDIICILFKYEIGTGAKLNVNGTGAYPIRTDEVTNLREHIITSQTVATFMWNDIEDDYSNGHYMLIGTQSPTLQFDVFEDTTNNSGIMTIKRDGGVTISDEYYFVVGARAISSDNKLNICSLGFNTSGNWIVRITDGSGQPIANKKFNVVYYYTRGIQG